jgi:chromosome segregation ATPase
MKVINAPVDYVHGLFALLGDPAAAKAALTELRDEVQRLTALVEEAARAAADAKAMISKAEQDRQEVDALREAAEAMRSEYEGKLAALKRIMA